MDEYDLEWARAAYGSLSSDMTPDPELFHPDVEWHNAPDLPGGGVHHGIEAMMADIRAQGEAWDERRFYPVEVVKADDGIVVCLELTARGRASGVTINLEVFHVVTIEDGKVAQVRAFLERDAAFRAALGS